MVSECILCVLGFPMRYRTYSNDSYSLLYMYIYSYFETWLVTGLFLGMSSNEIILMMQSFDLWVDIGLIFKKKVWDLEGN